MSHEVHVDGNDADSELGAELRSPSLDMPRDVAAARDQLDGWYKARGEQDDPLAVALQDALTSRSKTKRLWAITNETFATLAVATMRAIGLVTV